jgi:hypothetical protein
MLDRKRVEKKSKAKPGVEYCGRCSFNTPNREKMTKHLGSKHGLKNAAGR